MGTTQGGVKMRVHLIGIPTLPYYVNKFALVSWCLFFTLHLTFSVDLNATP